MSTPRLKLAQLDTNKIEKDWEVAITKNVSYPREWFDKHPGAKPPITIECPQNPNWKIVAKTVAFGIDAGSFPPEIAVLYLYHCFSEVKQKLGSEWISFDRKIGAAGAEITLSDLVTFEQKNNNTLDLQAGELEETDEDRLANIVIICAAYRISGVSRLKYRKSIVKTVKNLLKGITREERPIDLFLMSQLDWLNHRPFKQMMAVIDMYLKVFPYCKYAKARVGTIVSRFKDCSLLLALQSCVSSLGLSFSEFAPWVWTPKCADQLLQVIKEDQELDNPRSYAMYFMELGLSEISPYSTSMNPDLNFFIHAIGATCGNERSCNANMVGSPDITNILPNAMIIAYVFKKFCKLSLQFAYEGEFNSKEDDAPETYDYESGQIPNSRNPNTWLTFILANRGKIPEQISQVAHKQWRKNPRLRNSTIGKFLSLKETDDIIFV
ncbi:uncharacterized protein LOC129954268 [Eupeodes corollae]|uniref:uncharacterized protein LOC129954268 n=1 Tax=Eupeodes corollae TaxID=290404 RepID=UPI0024918FD4|nr:uncharacterized protein LOC129954268 [Eupeodes corollae]